MVAFELEVLAKHVDRFGWDRDRGTPAHDRMMKDWMEVLQDYPIQEIHDACIAAITARPNSIPNYGHVKAQIIAARQKASAAQPKPRPHPKPYTPPSNAQKAAANDMAREFARRAGIKGEKK